MAANQDVLIEVANNVATITLNRPTRANSITPDMVLLLLDAIETFEKDNAVRVIVITGAVTMGERLKDGTASSSAIRLFNTIYKCTKPVIAKVNGPAMGGGWGLVFTADIILADKSAFFQFSEVKRGIVPAIISAFVTPQLGLAQTKQLMITGRKITAEEGYKLGFITALSNNTDELNKITKQFVDGLLENGPEAMKRTKELVKYAAEHGHEENLQQVEKVFQVTIQSHEAMYGMSCFMQRQKPDWTAFYAESKL